jgi:hypothetical protein
MDKMFFTHDEGGNRKTYVEIKDGMVEVTEFWWDLEGHKHRNDWAAKLKLLQTGDATAPLDDEKYSAVV